MPRFTGSPSAIYKKWHWGLPHGKVIPVKDRYLGGRSVIEIGRLFELHIVPLDRDSEVSVLAVDPEYVNKSHVVFDPKHPSQRIWFVLPPEAMADARELWANLNVDTLPLASVAQAVGSVHGAGGYPNVLVKPLGWLQDLVYQTHKKGDDAELTNGKVIGIGSNYIHRMGEEGGVEPILAVSADGRLWLAGGSYTCPVPGITR